MPLVKGAFIGEVERSMPLKRTLTVLLWLDRLTRRDAMCLLDIDRLRILLKTHLDSPCAIRLLIPPSAHLSQGLSALDISVESTREAAVNGLRYDTQNASLQEAIAQAVVHDVDYIVTAPELLPYIEEVDQHFFVTLTDTTFLLKCIEVFVRGLGVPWSFTFPMTYQPFTTLYLLTERESVFQDGFDLMNEVRSTGLDSETLETGRTLVYNRLSNICFTRDQLLFYVQQRQAALRNGVSRQEFKLETAYYLNFYYLLLHGALDHAAMLANGILNLGLKNRDVGAAYPRFLAALRVKSAELHSVFTKPSTVQLFETFSALRHYAAHRGSISPSLIVEAPDRELSDAEIDEELRREGGYEWLFEMADSSQKESLLQMMRSNKRAQNLEQNVLARDVVFFESQGKRYSIQPLNDITYNFDRVIAIMREIFTVLGRNINKQLEKIPEAMQRDISK